MLWTQKRNDQSFPSCGSKGYTVRGHWFFVGHLIHAAYPISVPRYLETLLYLIPSVGIFFFYSLARCVTLFFCLGHTHTHIHIHTHRHICLWMTDITNNYMSTLSVFSSGTSYFFSLLFFSSAVEALQKVFLIYSSTDSFYLSWNTIIVSS